MTPDYRVQLSEDDADRRIEAVLRSHLGIPRSAVMKKLRTGRVRLDGRKVRKPAERVAAGQHLEVRGGRPVEGAAGDPVTPKAGGQAALRARTIFEDGELLVYDKPAGVVVHSGSGHQRGLVDDLVAMSGGARPGFRPALAHRLDRDTSGLIVLCRTGPSLRAMAAAIRERRVQKGYLGVVQGVPQPASGAIEVPLLRVTSPGQDRMEPCPGGGADALDAATTFTTERTADGPAGPVALLNLGLLTGRRHQLRAHLRYLGHPIAGDPRYGDAAWNARLRQELGFTRLALHAASLRFPHPRTGDPLDLRSPLPDDLAALLTQGR